jgi:uncharacterized protein (TIGR02001 family)
MFMRMPVKFRQSLRALALTGFLAPAAHAQISGSAGILSNYMYRGISLSAGKAAARLSLNYDDPAGWYAGGQVVSGQLAVETHRSAQWIGYAGYAQRLANGLSWDAGATAYAYPSASGWNFREFYVGLASEQHNVRLHYAPNYLGFSERTLYAEVNGGQSLTQRLHFFWHGGYLHSPDNSANSRAEARIGIGASHGGWQAQLSLDVTRLRQSTVASNGPYGYSSPDVDRTRHEIVLAVARTF